MLLLQKPFLKKKQVARKHAFVTAFQESNAQRTALISKLHSDSDAMSEKITENMSRREALIGNIQNMESQIDGVHEQLERHEIEAKSIADASETYRKRYVKVPFCLFYRISYKRDRSAKIRKLYKMLFCPLFMNRR